MSTIVDERVSDEVAALEAILLDDVDVKSLNGAPYAIETVVHPSTGDDADQQFVCITLEVMLTPDYPDNSPDVVLRNSRGLDDALLDSMYMQIKKKLQDCLGHPVVFDLIELVRDNLTKCNLPTGQCAICLYGFAEGDIFSKTDCYHHFHSHCLANHVIAGEKNYKEELDKLPQWQRLQEAPYQQSCPVCRSVITCNVDTLKRAPPPAELLTAEPFKLTPELEALQKKMAALLAKQVAKGGVVGTGDTGPPPLTITTPDDHARHAASAAASAAAREVPKPDIASPQIAHSSTTNNITPSSPRNRHYRGYRRGKPGRGRGHPKGGFR